MCCALGKPDPLLGQLTEPIPWLHHLPSPTFQSPLGLSGSLLPPTASTQTKGGSGRTDVAVGQKLCLLHHLFQGDMRTPRWFFRWFVISSLVLSTRQGLGPEMEATHPPASAPTQNVSTLAVCNPEGLQPQNSLRAFIPPPPHTPATSQ